MPAPNEKSAPSWSVRLTTDLDASDQTATSLFSGLTDEQLNWQPSPGAWSVGQCLDHLRIFNEVYPRSIAAALKGKPSSPVDQIKLGWFADWFVRSFAEPSPQNKRAKAPGKIRPPSRVDPSVLERFLSSKQACRDLIQRARELDINRIRFWNPFMPGVRFTVGAGLQIIVSHERRHLLQAKRVKDSPNFPR